MKGLDDSNFRSFLAETAGDDNVETVISALSGCPSVSVRLNPYKKYDFAKEGLKPVPWNSFGYFLETRPSFTFDPMFHAGAYYVQDSSAMFVGEVFRKVLRRVACGNIIKVLDLCASPGGKTTDLAASLRQKYGNDFLLVSNEVIRQRASVLADNVAIWGDPNVVVTSADPKVFSSMSGFFDIILADVPCSGEGMFRKDPDSVSEWSPDVVHACALRQKRIVADVWPALADGGVLIYSTCTFNKYENDDNVLWLSDKFGAEVISGTLFDSLPSGVFATDCGFMLLPGFVNGEGQYCSASVKSSMPLSYAGRSGLSTKKKKKRKVLDLMTSSVISTYFDYGMEIYRKGDYVVAMPSSVAVFEEDLDVLNPLTEGLAVGWFKRNDFIPSADLALSIATLENIFPSVELDLKQSLAFLHKDAIVVPDSPKGYVMVKYNGVPLGFVKNLGSRCNNLHPVSRRIKKDIDLL
jgi:16S rRNA C967 or C1407 C5-methylase (RsmB/RsmF family)/NOL1/NOP2/fmu family ribosome biogenesis protein